MALTRKALKAMGLTDEQIDSVVEMHTETVDGLKEQLRTVGEKADKLDGVQKELDALKAKNGDDYKAKYEAEKKAFADYKAEQTAKETKAAKETAARAYFEGKKITGNNLTIAMRGAKDEISKLELDENGSIKDSSALDELVNGEYSSLIVTTQVKGANIANPPQNVSGSKMSKEDILKIKDTQERQRAIAENLNLFKK